MLSSCMNVICMHVFPSQPPTMSLLMVVLNAHTLLYEEPIVLTIPETASTEALRTVAAAQVRTDDWCECGLVVTCGACVGRTPLLIPFLCTLQMKPQGLIKPQQVRLVVLRGDAAEVR